MLLKHDIPEKTTRGISCPIPEMVTRWIVWAVLGVMWEGVC